MGSCFSKCRHKKYSFEEKEEEFEHTRDKIIISQTPKNPLPISNKVSPFPLSPITTTSSCFSSASAPSYTSTTSSNSTSVSSCSYSVLSSKDRSFSNEFLWACVKENPHIIRINSIKEAALASASSKPHAQKLESPSKPVAVPKKEKGFSPHKRGRSSSPIALPRQKSFRKEPEVLNPGYSSLQSRTLKSPSPSRRFSGEFGRGISSNTSKANCSKRFRGRKVTPVNPVSSSSPRNENFHPVSPISSSSEQLRPCLRNRETCIHRITSKIDEIAVAAALTEQDGDTAMEDIDNPLISFDCFTFI
ncbi:hypothetical protein SLA2020_088190 [Shorea laevis]